MRHTLAQTGAKGQTAGPLSQLVAGSGQKSHEIDLPDKIANLESVEEFHKAVKKHLAKSGK
jgi:hypothetical protein